MNFTQIFLFLSFTLFILIIAIAGLIFINRFKVRGRLNRALNMSLFLISLPKKNKEEGETSKSEKEIISAMEQLYSSLNNIKEKKKTFIYGQPHLVFEIATSQVGEEIIFYLALPQRYEDVVEKQIHGFYPDASVEKVEDYNIFNPEGVTMGSYLKLARDSVLPIKTYQNLEIDPLQEITNTLSKLEEKGEGAVIQIVFRPASSEWRKAGQDIAKEMQEGKSFSQAKSDVSGNWFVKLTKELRGNASLSQQQNQKLEPKQPSITPGQEEIIKAIEEKASKIGFDVNLRILVSAGTEQKAKQILNHLESAFVQFNDPNLNELKSFRLQKGRGLKKLIYNFSFRLFNNKQKILLNTEELSSLFHFPTTNIKTPKVKFLKAKSSAPPANLPKQGIILGKNFYRGVETVICMQKNDRRRHLYTIGQTGTGKSVFLQNMIVQDIRDGQGVGLIDVHGDLVENILGLIPQERVKDVVVFNPADLERPLGLNMLEYDPKYPEQKTFVVNELINIFDKLYDLKTTGGPMFEQYARNALLLLIDDPTEKFTLMEVSKVLADEEFRIRLLSKCNNTVVKDFWEKEAQKAGGEIALANMVPYITSKFNVFTTNDYMRPIIGQPVNSINFRQIMDEKKILLVNLSKGRLGDINSSLLGLIITGKLLMAAFSRVDIAEEERQDFYFYIDEFQNFATDSIATILSEARKYRLSLIMAHQFIGQLEDKIKGAIFGNVGSMVSFRTGAEDAEFLVKQFEPVFDEHDLINIDNFNAYIKLMINNQTSIPFNLLTEPPQKGNSRIAQAVKEYSRLKYGRDKKIVNEEIASRWQQSIYPKHIKDNPLPNSDIDIK